MPARASTGQFSRASTEKPRGLIFEQPNIGEDGGSWFYVYPAVPVADPEWWDPSPWECDLDADPLAGPFDTENEADEALKELSDA